MKTADKKELLKSKQFWLNVGTGVLAILFVGVLIWGFGQAASVPGTELEDGIRLSYEDFLHNPMRAER